MPRRPANEPLRWLLARPQPFSQRVKSLLQSRALISNFPRPLSAPSTFPLGRVHNNNNNNNKRISPTTERSSISPQRQQQQQRLELHLTSQNSRRRSSPSCETLLEAKFKMEWPKVTLFGDSITRRSTDVENGCWGSMIEYKINSFFDLDPRGFEGYNSKWALQLMPKLFPRSYLEKVQIFIPFFGHNDSWENTFPLHVPVEQYEANMRAIVKYLLDNGLGKSKIILITPTWFHLDKFTTFLQGLGYPLTKKELGSAKKYSEAILRIAKDEQLDVLDFFDISSKYEPLGDLFCDGVHLSRTGAKLLFDNLMPIVEKKLVAAFEKPLADMWHAVPVEQHEEVEPVLKAFQASQAKQ